MHTATRRYMITVEGSCPVTLRDLLATRFDLTSAPADRLDIVVVDQADQATLRSLLTALWDAGMSVLAVRSSDVCAQ